MLIKNCYVHFSITEVSRIGLVSLIAEYLKQEIETAMSFNLECNGF